ncbi:MAG: hypothetical protein ACXWZB_08115, partial [Gaiellaceae bacterium]
MVDQLARTSAGHRAGFDVAQALAELAQATRSLSRRAPLEETLAELVGAAALGSSAELAVLWLPESDGTVAARSVWSVSAGLAAEIEGQRAKTLGAAADLVRRRLDESAVGLTIPCEAGGGGGALELVRRGAPFEQEQEQLATLAAELAGLAAGLEGGLDSRQAASGALDIAGDALAAAAADDGAPARVARLAAIAAGAEAALVWRVRDAVLEVEGAYGAIVADDALEQAARSIVDDLHPVVVSTTGGSRQIVTLQLGQPVLGALQVRFP